MFFSQNKALCRALRAWPVWLLGPVRVPPGPVLAKLPFFHGHRGPHPPGFSTKFRGKSRPARVSRPGFEYLAQAGVLPDGRLRASPPPPVGRRWSGTQAVGPVSLVASFWLPGCLPGCLAASLGPAGQGGTEGGSRAIPKCAGIRVPTSHPGHRFWPFCVQRCRHQCRRVPR